MGQAPTLPKPIRPAPGPRRRVWMWSPLLAAATLLLTAIPLRAADDPERLLERMNDALERVQFEGTLVYLHGHDLSALRVSHRVQDGTPGESMLSLTGPVRALSRHAEGVTCMLPDAAPLTVRKGHGNGSILRGMPLDFARIERFYRISHLGRFRVAGRDTDVVGVLARDGFRYGYRFYVDEASGVPLKVDLLTGDETPVQQIMFTDIAIDPSSVNSGNAARGHAGAQTSARRAPPESDAEPVEAADWLPAELPPGFRLISQERVPRDDGATIRQLVLSDGLAAFSIYLEPPLDGALQGESRLGAVSAAGGLVGDYQATVVGEVPPATVRTVLGGIRPRSRP
jgi:sigma-E factor negative regulatory protein RseB